MSGQLEPNYCAIRDYQPQHDGEIELVAGDSITNVKDLTNGWMLGRNATRDTVGIFPSHLIIPENPAITTDPPPRDLFKSQREVDRKGSGPLVDFTDIPSFDPNDLPPPPPEEDLIITPEVVPPPEIPVYDQGPLNAAPKPPKYEKLYSSGVKRRKAKEKGDRDKQNKDPNLIQKSPDEPDFSTSSLPSPRKIRYNRNPPKPHMFVRPNAGKNIFLHPSDTSVKGANSESELQGSPDECRARTYSNPSCQSTPTPTRTRTSLPPGQLPNINSEEFMMGESSDQDSPINRRESSGATIIANVSPEQEISPEDYVPQIAPVVQPSLESSERQNMTNENITQKTPPMTRKEPKQQFYSDYRTLECPVADKTPPVQKRFKPILKNRHAHAPYGPPHQKANEICYRDERESRRSFRLVCSILAGLLFGFVLFLWMYFALDYAFMIAILTGISIALLSMLAFAISRLCRTIGALLIPSVCTTRGRIAFLVFITGFLLDGPITNIYINMGEVSRAMSCSAEQSYNQSMLLLQPFDAMMENLNHTVRRLQEAAHNVSLGLSPLDNGLNLVELDLYNGNLELTGTAKTCRNLIDIAFADCGEGIEAAKNQCLGVIGTLGTVYHHARDVLDRINPDRWAPKQTISLQKRQVIFGSELDNIPENDRDICEPLDMYTVCQSLNDSDLLCQPSGWAGEAIHDAVNATQNAMKRLQRTLHFEINPEPYVSTRINASKVLYSVRQKVHDEFYGRTAYFHYVIGILMKIVPVAVLLLIYVSYLHVKNYVSKDTYDNVYVTPQFKTLDQKRCEFAGESLLPLKKFERNYLIDTTVSELSPPEDGLYRLGLCVLCLHLLIAFLCYMFDYILYWILAMIQRHSDPKYDFTGKDSLQLVVLGEGVITDLLHVFLKGFHPANLFGYTLDLHVCLPNPTPPSIFLLLVIFLLYFTLILSILLKAYILRFRNRVTSHFYPEREKARVVHLYNVVLNQRFRMPKLLQLRAKVNNREKLTREQISVCHRMAAKVPLCRVFVYKQARCLVCGCVEDQTFRDCQTEHCQGVFCGECFDDLARLCPICHQAEYSDEEDYEELEDDLQPYCRSSKIYV